MLVNDHMQVHKYKNVIFFVSVLFISYLFEIYIQLNY